MSKVVSYYERLDMAARQLFGEDVSFNFCRVIKRNHYHMIVRGDEVLAKVRLKDIPSGKRIITTFQAAAEALGNVDQASIRPVLQQHKVI